MATPPRLQAIPPPFHGDAHLVYRIEKLEDHSDELDKEKRRLSDAVLLLGIKLEAGLAELSNKIKHFEERKTFWNRILIGIITAGAIAIVTHLLRISYIVQANRIAGGE